MPTLVEVAGYNLAVETRGAGDPPVAFLVGLNDDRRVWDDVLTQLTVATTFVTYDRPGLGDSDALTPEEAAQPQGYGHTVEELRAVLTAANVPSPRVLVGHSIGALIAQVYASRYPDEVAGLVTVDATDPQLYIDVTEFGPTVTDEEDKGTLFDWRLGLADLQRSTLPKLPAVVIASSVGRWATAYAPEKYQPYTMADVDERWQRWEQSLAHQLGAPLIVAHHTGHYVHTEAPALVARAVEAVVTAARASEAVALDGRAVEQAGGTLRADGERAA